MYVVGGYFNPFITRADLITAGKKREEREMKTHKTRVSNSPGKLRLLETCQHEFREKLNISHACYIIFAELSYETQYKTWFRPRLRH